MRIGILPFSAILLLFGVLIAACSSDESDSPALLVCESTRDYGPECDEFHAAYDDAYRKARDDNNTYLSGRSTGLLDGAKRSFFYEGGRGRNRYCPLDPSSDIAYDVGYYGDGYDADDGYKIGRYDGCQNAWQRGYDDGFGEARPCGGRDVPRYPPPCN